MSGNHKHRKKGDWVAVVRSRVGKQRELTNGRGVSNIPSVTQTGSAAYRRLQAKQQRTGR